MSTQFEDTEDTSETADANDGDGGSRLLFDDHDYEEGKDGDQIDQVKARLKELPLVGTAYETDQVFYGKPGAACHFDEVDYIYSCYGYCGIVLCCWW